MFRSASFSSDEGLASFAPRHRVRCTCEAVAQATRCRLRRGLPQMARASCDERPRPLGVSSWAVREPCRGIRNNGFDDRCYEFRSSDTAHTGQYDRGADIQVGRRLLFAELLARPVTSKFIAWGKGRQRTAFPSNCTSERTLDAACLLFDGDATLKVGDIPSAGTTQDNAGATVGSSA
jgi:hypothetical protein